MMVQAKSYVASLFYCLGVRNAMVSLMMPSASHDVDTGAIGVT